MARLHEYQGKAILAAHGFKVPRGRAAFTADALRGPDQAAVAEATTGCGLSPALATQLADSIQNLFGPPRKVELDIPGLDELIGGAR
jgi:hypothetical protein